MKIRHHVAARLDVLEIVKHYEKAAGTDIAAEFFDELLAYFDQIAEPPESFRAVRQNLRRVNLHRFPHNIIFEIVDIDTVQILVVRHNRRHPNYGWDRI